MTNWFYRRVMPPVLLQADSKITQPIEETNPSF